MLSMRDNHFNHVALPFVALTLAERHDSGIQQRVVFGDLVHGPRSSLRRPWRDEECSPAFPFTDSGMHDAALCAARFRHVPRATAHGLTAVIEEDLVLLAQEALAVLFVHVV
jgi:hypothetical protein